MANEPTTDETRERSPGDGPKTRQCLRCSNKFESEWSGERVCPHCKKSSTWRNGLSVIG